MVNNNPIQQAIEALQAEQHKIEIQIEQLQKMLGTSIAEPSQGKPIDGRSAEWSDARRKAVARRMKAYWRKRREQETAAKTEG